MKDLYVFHKKSIKLLKGKQYKAWRGGDNIIPDYVLPEAYHVDHHKKVMDRMKRDAEELFGKHN